MPIQRSFGTIPKKLPNVGSKHQTPASLMTDAHYAQLQLVERWTWPRYAQLCRFLNMTPWELASLVMLSHDAVENYRKVGRLNRQGYRAVALVLTLLEHHVMSKWTDDTIASPFPDMSVPPPIPEKKPWPFRKRTHEPT